MERDKKGRFLKQKEVSKEFIKAVKHPPFCKCGCGKKIVIKRHHKYYGIPKYIIGHHTKDGNHPMLGKHHTTNSKEKISNNNKWNHHSPETEFKKGQVSWNKGVPLSKLAKDNLRNKNLGKKQSKETIIKRWLSTMKTNVFTGFICSKNTQVRASTKYKLWRKAIFERDCYICQECGKKGGKLEAHHIFPVSKCLLSNKEELIYNLKNGITLCQECHIKIDNLRGRAIKKGTGYLNFTGTGETRCNATINTTSMGDPGANGILYIQDSCIIYIRS